MDTKAHIRSLYNQIIRLDLSRLSFQVVSKSRLSNNNKLKYARPNRKYHLRCNAISKSTFQLQH